MEKNMHIFLASSSPRRRELMKYISPDCQIRPSGADEELPCGTSPGSAVETLALRKADSVRSRLTEAEKAECVVIGADTVVWLDGRMLGKPSGGEEAAAMLRELSGRVNRVFTGVALLGPDVKDVFHTEAEVLFYPLDEELIRSYVATGDPLDKAGAYGAQGPGSVLIKEIRGDFFTVMGLPVAEVYRHLLAAGCDVAPRSGGT